MTDTETAPSLSAAPEPADARVGLTFVGYLLVTVGAALGPPRRR